MKWNLCICLLSLSVVGYSQNTRSEKNPYSNDIKNYKIEKPRYANPLYFGHRRPPKKRPLGKQKFCKTCRIKH